MVKVVALKTHLPQKRRIYVGVTKSASREGKRFE